MLSVFFPCVWSCNDARTATEIEFGMSRTTSGQNSIMKLHAALVGSKWVRLQAMHPPSCHRPYPGILEAYIRLETTASFTAAAQAFQYIPSAQTPPLRWEPVTYMLVKVHIDRQPRESFQRRKGF